VLAAIATLQATVLATPLGFPAPLLLVLVVSRTLLGIGAAFPDIGLSRALRWALYGGITLDLLAATPLGAHALALLVVVFVVAAATRRLRVERLLIPLVAITVAAPLYEGILALLTQPGPVEWRSYSQVVILPVTLAALVLMLPTFFVLRWALRGQQ
jgi:rod shape-determining protein MreD